MKYVDTRDLPPCALSPQCLRLLEDLDEPPIARVPARLSHIKDLQDERLLRQVRSHITTCFTCSTLLARARSMRTQQRALLRHALASYEKQVPSTAQAIFHALHKEHIHLEDGEEASGHPYQLHLVLMPPAQKEERTSTPLHSGTRLSRHQRIFQQILTIATIFAVIFGAFGLLDRFTEHSGLALNEPAQPTPNNKIADNYGWDSMVVGLTLISATGLTRSFTLTNFSLLTGQTTTLLSMPETDARLEGVSADGENLLYDTVSLKNQRIYTSFSASARESILYQLSVEQAGNAIWMDASHVLVQNTTGTLLELDVATDMLQASWPIKVGKLISYNQPFLYFTDPTTSALYRTDLMQRQTSPQQITVADPNTRFWFSPDQSTIYYTNKDASGQQATYSVASDGTSAAILRKSAGMPIGYTKDNSALMFLQQVNSEVQLIKLGATPQQKDQLVLANAAPGAISLCGPAQMVTLIALCTQNIALDPYGRGLLVHAYYADGSHSLIYDDLTTGTSHRIMTLASNVSVQLPGWWKATPGKTVSIAPNQHTELLTCA